MSIPSVRRSTIHETHPSTIGRLTVVIKYQFPTISEYE